MWWLICRKIADQKKKICTSERNKKGKKMLGFHFQAEAGNFLSILVNGGETGAFYGR